MLVIGIGLVGAGMLGNSLVSILFFSTAAIGIYGAKAPFWPLPSMFLSGSAAAVGIALINSIGNLGGFAGPYIVGWVKDSTGSFESGLYALSAFGFVAAIAILLVVRPEQHRRRQAIPCRAASRE
jgi:nitrate/nitrite transporter NarK